MKARDWQDVLEDVADAKADPGDWHAVIGNRVEGIGEDVFLGHPRAGVYQLKTYAKNPFEIQGVGTQVARHLDDDLEPLFPEGDSPARFGIKRGVSDEAEVKRRGENLKSVFEDHRESPKRGIELFDEVMDALESPAHGPMEFDGEHRPTELDALTDTFDEAETLLTSELDELIDRSGINRGFY